MQEFRRGSDADNFRFSDCEEKITARPFPWSLPGHLLNDIILLQHSKVIVLFRVTRWGDNVWYTGLSRAARFGYCQDLRIIAMHYEWLDISSPVFIIYIYININAPLNRWVIIRMTPNDNLILNLNSRKAYISIHVKIYSGNIRKNLDALTPHQIIDPLAPRLHTSSLFMSINRVTHCDPHFSTLTRPSTSVYRHQFSTELLHPECDFQTEVAAICPDLWSFGTLHFTFMPARFRDATRTADANEMTPQNWRPSCKNRREHIRLAAEGASVFHKYFMGVYSDSECKFNPVMLFS